MIGIVDKKDCCGCSACVRICPVKCIHLQEDAEGFLYPVVDKAGCIECGRCEKACPFLNAENGRKPLKVFAAQSMEEELRACSSSGGIFTLLAMRTIEEGGVVFGVRFDEEWRPVFDYADTVEGIAAFRGSKYVQAIVGNAYVEAKAFLEQGRKVMFCGTPCQIAGLKRFMRSEPENLLAVDVVCHGVPSPLVWRQYLRETVKSEASPVITGICFRDKKTGWKKYSLVVRGKSVHDGQDSILVSEMHMENRFMQAFLSDMILRQSCYACKVKGGRSLSDITIADFWGVSGFHPEMDDDLGTNLVFAYTEKGLEHLNAVLPETRYTGSEYENGIYANPCVENSPAIPKYRHLFWKDFLKTGMSAMDIMHKRMQARGVRRLFWSLRDLFR